MKRKEAKVQRTAGYIIGAAGLAALIWNLFSFTWQGVYDKYSTVAGIILLITGFLLVKKAA